MEAFMGEAEWKLVAAAAAALPSDSGPLVIRYIGLFAPGGRGLNANRAGRLLGELTDMILNGTSFDRQEIKAPSHVWRQALQSVLDAPDLRPPLKNHNYLLRVVQGALARRDDISQAERGQERRGQAHVRSGGMQHVSEAAELTDDALPDIPIEERDRWIERAKEVLRKEHGLKPGAFMSEALIDHMARELYAKQQEVNHAAD